MTTYNTGNPLGSTDPRDLYDNAEVFDSVINSTSDTVDDRLGNERKTLKWMEDAATGIPAIEAAAAAEAARDAAQFYAGIYATTVDGLAATTNGEYFSVPGETNTVLSLYKNNSGTAQFINNFPAAFVAGLGRVMFTRSGTTFTFNDITGTSVEVGWSTLRFWKGNSNYRKVADRAAAELVAGNALYIDVAVDTTNDYPVLEDTLANIAVDIIQGTKILLVANYVNGFLVGELAEALIDSQFLNNRRQVGVHDGKVAFSNNLSTPMPSYDPVTLTLTWPEMIILIKDRVLPLFKRIKLEAGSIVFPTGSFWVAALDLTQADYDLTPASAVSVTQYFDDNFGWAGEDDDWLPLFCVSNGVSYPISFPPTTGSTALPSAVDSSEYRQDEIVVIGRSDEVDIYIKGSKPTSNRYLRYRMQCKPNEERSSNVWRLNEVWEAERVGEYSFNALRMICQGGENEMAILQTGKSDFMGGVIHGDEVKYSIIMLIDGSAVTVGATSNYRCRSIEFLQASYLYEVDTVPPKANLVANSYKRWVFNSNNVEIFNTVKWQDSITLDKAYLSMLTFLRWNDTIQVSDSGYRSPYYVRELIGDTYKITLSLGGSNFVNGETVTITANDGTGSGMEGTATVSGGAITSIKVTKNGSNYTIGDTVTIASKSGNGSGATGTIAVGFESVDSTSRIAKAGGPSGYSAEVEILEGWDKPNRVFHFSNSENYNKFYFDFTGPDYVTQINELMQSRTRYRLDTKN